MNRESAGQRVAVYVRLSISQEASVSIERQKAAAEAYCKAHGWTVVAAFVDDGVSASKNRPEDRAGWQALMKAEADWDVVIVWKLDRLVRRLVNFWDVYRWLDERGKTLVSVEDRLDMSTTMGRILASIIAGFAEMEADAISARVTDARHYLLTNGRYPGGRLPYGWRAVENPDGAGWVIAQDPDRIDYVRGLAERTLAGKTLYSSMKWLDEVGAPTATGGPEWAYGTVDKLIRHPLLAGMVPHNPGRTARGRGDEVVRGEDGLPVVHTDLAVVSLADWRRIQARLAEPNDRRQPRSTRRKHSGVLSGLVWCADPRHDEPVRMWRGTVGSKTGPRPAYTCPDCHQTLSNAEALIVGHVLQHGGDLPMFGTVEEVVEGGQQVHAEASIRLAELGTQLAGASADRMVQILDEIQRLKELQADAAMRPAEIVRREVGGDQTVAAAYASATDDEERRAVIGSVLNRVLVRRGGQGAWTDAAKLARCEFIWSGQVVAPSDEVLADWASE